MYIYTVYASMNINTSVFSKYLNAFCLIVICIYIYMYRCTVHVHIN